MHVLLVSTLSAEIHLLRQSRWLVASPVVHTGIHQGSELKILTMDKSMFKTPVSLWSRLWCAFLTKEMWESRIFWFFYKQVKCTSLIIIFRVSQAEASFCCHWLTNEYQPCWETWQLSNKWLHYQYLIFREHALLWWICRTGKLFTPVPSEPQLPQ